MTKLKTQITTKLIKSNCYKTQNSNCSSKNKIVTKLNSNYDNPQKLKLWKNSKTQIVTVVIVSIMTVAVVTVLIVTYFRKDNLTPQQPMKFSRWSFSQFLRCLPVAFLQRSKIQHFTDHLPTRAGSVQDCAIYHNKGYEKKKKRHFKY